MSDKVTFQYKCRMCGKVFDDAQTGKEYGLMYLTSAMHGGTRLPTGQVMPPMIAHFCDDERMGAADIIGYRTEG
jgi:hypothetical protein